MKSATRSLFFFTALLSASHSYAGMLYNNFASCTAVIDGVPVELDFFSQYESDKPTGIGFSVQNSFGLKIMSLLSG